LAIPDILTPFITNLEKVETPIEIIHQIIAMSAFRLIWQMARGLAG